MAIKDLFEEDLQQIQICPGAMLFKGAAIESAQDLLASIHNMTQISPFRHMITPGGFKMSVAMTCCGQKGWITDKKGYRYVSNDPITQRPWPLMPELFLEIGKKYAQDAGFLNFTPDSAIINCYLPGTKLSLHQDKDEKNYLAPVVSISLGLPARFMFGGINRTDAIKRFILQHGDVFVFGGPARLNYHGVAPIKAENHFLLGEKRICITLRQAQ